VHTSIELDSPVERIAQLETRLRAAEERATVAEEQLRRVHEAVREFKRKQMQAAARRANAQVPATEAKPVDKSEQYATWRDSDPTLDDRLDEYLRSDFEPDRSRDWMLRP